MCVSLWVQCASESASLHARLCVSVCMCMSVCVCVCVCVCMRGVNATCDPVSILAVCILWHEALVAKVKS